MVAIAIHNGKMTGGLHDCRTPLTERCNTPYFPIFLRQIQLTWKAAPDYGYNRICSSYVDLGAVRLVE
jgi:hypothetical protein